MATQRINPSIRTIDGYPVDERVMYWDGDVWRPYVDAAEANSVILTARRHVGLLVRVAGGWYQYKNGTADADLIPFGSAKIPIKVDGVGGSPVAGAFTYTNALLIGADVHDIIVNKGLETAIDGDFTFNPTLGRITRVIAWVADDTAIINKI